MKKTALSTVVLCALSANVIAEEVKPFTMDGEFGLIVTTGNTETTSVKGKLSAHQELDKWSNDFIFDAIYQRNQVTENDEEIEKTTAQKYFLSGQGNYKLENPDHRIFIFGSCEDDRFNSYDYQSTVAAGWNQKLWSDETSSFEYSVGPGYSYAKFNDGTKADGLIVRAALDYQWKISDTSTFKQLLNTEIGDDNTKTVSETSLSAKLSGNLSMKFAVNMTHNSDVVGDDENLDTVTSATIVYTFF